MGEHWKEILDISIHQHDKNTNNLTAKHNWNLQFNEISISDTLWGIHWIYAPSSFFFSFFFFLAHLAIDHMWAFAITWCPSYIVNFHILIFFSETTGPIATKLWWNGPWMASFQNCVRWSRLPTKMAAKLKIEKRGDEIVIVHCCFSVSQNELKF
jgi:hypothetical protein